MSTDQPRCYECSGLGFCLVAGRPKNCWRLSHVTHPETPAAASVRRAVDDLVARGIPVDVQAFNIAKLLAAYTTKRPFDKAGLLTAHLTLPLRSFMGIIEDLRKVWLLPVGSRKYAPSGYWIITDPEDFHLWAASYRNAPLTQLSTLHRVAKRNFPLLVGQLELEFSSLYAEPPVTVDAEVVL